MILGLSAEEVADKFRKGDIRFTVFGMGKMGLPLAAVIADRGGIVTGVDIDPQRVEMINSGENPIKEEPGLTELVRKGVSEGRLRATVDGVRAVRESDVHVILVPTLVDEHGNVDLSIVREVAGVIAKGLKKGDVVITECTMPPGSTEGLIPILEESGLKLGDFGVAHCPERTMTGTAIRDITGKYPKIIGASDPETLEVVKGIYTIINVKGVYPVSDIKTAEAVKVFEGIYRDVNIALANELAMYCEELGIDAIEAFAAANSQPYCHIHRPGSGVGGHCIPFYPHFAMRTARRRIMHLTRTAREINDLMPVYTAHLVVRALSDAGRSVRSARVLVMGLTFRGGVREFRKTPAEGVIAELMGWGADVCAYDPMCTPEDAARFGVGWAESPEGFDCLVFVTDHREFRNFNLDRAAELMRTRCIVDGRQVIDPGEARKRGFIYYGIGRK